MRSTRGPSSMSSDEVIPIRREPASSVRANVVAILLSPVRGCERLLQR